MAVLGADVVPAVVVGEHPTEYRLKPFVVLGAGAVAGAKLNNLAPHHVAQPHDENLKDLWCVRSVKHFFQPIRCRFDH